MNIIEVKNLSKNWRKNSILNNVTFNVKKGSFHIFAGQNGSGKTSTIKCIVDAYINFSGEIHINNKKHSLMENKQLIAYVPENSLFPNKMSCLTFLSYMYYIEGKKMIDAKSEAEKFLKEIGLKDKIHKNANDLSSGEKKKLMLAQALIKKPQIIIMDEPLSNLDQLARKSILIQLDKACKSGATIFIATHNLSDFDKLTNEVTLINKGKIHFNGLKKDFIKGKKSLADSYISWVEGFKNA